MAKANCVTSDDARLADDVGLLANDPYGFVRYAYPWGLPGPLKDYDGPDVWQREFLVQIGEQVTARGFDGLHAVEPIRNAVSSGHGIGKSVCSAWLTNWIMSTRPHSQGTITANTYAQLQTKTWAAIQRWTKLCITGHWFQVGADRMMALCAPESWFVSAQTCREENSESFAGQHAATSTSWYLFDEASAVPDAIWEVAEGGLTDGEPMIFAFGNPTRNNGKFHRICFGAERNRWRQRVIDSRECKFTNRQTIADWIEDYGEDSDFVRVRVRGLPPAASDLQFIDATRVYEAQLRQSLVLPDEPLICGLDVARGGSDHCVFRFRRGLDARTIPSVRIPGEQARDSMRLVTVAADILTKAYDGQRVHTLFIDATGIGGPIGDRLRQLGHRNVVDVQFGAHAPERQYANMRAFMWARLREWLTKGAIEKSSGLEMDLTGPGYAHNKQDQVVLESKEDMKKRGMDSPDDADALALTFAAPIAPVGRTKVEEHRIYDPQTAGLGWLGT